MSEADDITRALLEGTLGIAEHGLAERVERPEGPFSPCSQCARRVTQDFVTWIEGEVYCPWCRPIRIYLADNPTPWQQQITNTTGPEPVSAQEPTYRQEIQAEFVEAQEQLIDAMAYSLRNTPRRFADTMRISMYPFPQEQPEPQPPFGRVCEDGAWRPDRGLTAHCAACGEMAYERDLSRYANRMICPPCYFDAKY
jgi:hypothetical protein